MDNPRELVREFRRRHKLTQVELARLMARTSNYISMVERGDRPPSEQFMAHLELLDRILTVEPEYRKRAIIKESPEDDPPPLATIVVHPSARGRRGTGRTGGRPIPP